MHSAARDPFPQDKLNIEATLKNRKVLRGGLCGRPWVKKENIYILKQFETLDDILDSWSGWELIPFDEALRPVMQLVRRAKE